MKVAAIAIIMFMVIALYQIQKYSLGYHKLAIAHEVNTEALVAQGLQITFLQDEVQRQRKLNIDMANEVDSVNGAAASMFMIGCMDAGKPETKCFKLQRKYKTGAQ